MLPRHAAFCGSGVSRDRHPRTASSLHCHRGSRRSHRKRGWARKPARTPRCFPTPQTQTPALAGAGGWFHDHRSDYLAPARAEACGLSPPAGRAYRPTPILLRPKGEGRPPCGNRPSDKAPGDDLLLHGLGHTTIGACAFHFRVRNGIGWFHTAIITRERVEGRGSRWIESRTRSRWVASDGVLPVIGE